MTEPVKRYNMDVGKFGNVHHYESEHGRWVKRDDCARIEKDCERFRAALEFACKSLVQVTSSDGSGHADLALAALRMAGVDASERERMVEEWKSTAQWRLDAALSADPCAPTK